MPDSFFCPECGAALELDPGDAGRRVECGACGAGVRVPSAFAGDDLPGGDEPRRRPIPAAAAAAAAGGLWFLQISLGLYVLGLVFSLAVNAARLIVDGPANVFGGKPGPADKLVLAAGIVGLLVQVTAAGLRLAGYRRCGPAAGVVGGRAGLMWAAVGVGMQIVGGVAIVVPSLLLAPPGGPPGQFPFGTALLLLVAGGLFGTLGAGLEFLALFFHNALLKRAGGPADARRVPRYLLTFGVLTAGLFFGSCVLGAVVGVVLAAKVPPRGGPPPPVNPANLPVEVLVAAGVGALFSLFGGAVLCWQYYQILTTGRAGLAAISEPTDGQQLLADRTDS